MKVKKPNYPYSDLDDVTLGSPAVLPTFSPQTIVEQKDPWFSVRTSRWVWF